MRQRQSEKGIAHLGVILVAIMAIAAVTLGGWYVWQKNNDDKQPSNSSSTSQTNNTQRREKEPSINVATDWESVATQGGAFSMKVPDGWTITRYPDNLLGAMEVTYEPGKRAVVEISNTEYVGHSLRFRASVTSLDDAGLGPQWASPQPGLQESAKDFSIGTLQGKRYKGVFTQDLNQTLYEYVFDLGDNKKLDIVYIVDHSKDENDDVATVEKAIKTIQLE